MEVAKSIVSVLMSVVYVCTFGLCTFHIVFPDGEELYMEGWL